MPTIIVLDINMPKMNGSEFLGIIKGHFSLKNIKGYMLATSTEPNDKSSTENKGIYGYQVKPLTSYSPFL